MRLRFICVSMCFILGICSCYAKNEALLIGIGDYDTASTGWNKIHGNNDVKMLEGKLAANGFNVKELTDAQATKSNISSALKQLASSTAVGDRVYIHFSGHGQLIEDMNKDEEQDLDQSFVCYDACFSSNYKVGGASYRGQNHFIDDELFPYLNKLKTKVGKNGKVIVVFDSCYSGGADRGEGSEEQDPESDVEWDCVTRGTDDEFKLNKNAELYLRTIKKPGFYKGEGILTVISACKNYQKNYECKEKHSGRKYGSLSYTIGKLLDNGIPIDHWGEYFSSGKFRNMKIFRPSQHPVVETYR